MCIYITGAYANPHSVSNPNSSHSPDIRLIQESHLDDFENLSSII